VRDAGTTGGRERVLNLLLRQFATFTGVGLIAAVAHFGVLIVLVEGGDIRPVIATLWAFLAGVAVSYLLNRRYTFRSGRPHRAAAPRFFAVSAGGFALNGAVMWFLIESWGVPYLIAQVVATAFVLIWNFSANRWWTFRAGTEDSNGD
jgi:putative flippase GtrA